MAEWRKRSRIGWLATSFNQFIFRAIDDVSVDPKPAGLGRGKTSGRTNLERTAQTRQTIMDAVIEILFAQGFSSVSNSLIVNRAGVSSGALMHQFPSRTDLLVATVRYAYDRLTKYRAAQLETLDPGLPRFRAIIDLSYATARMPEGIAVNEVRIGARSNADLARALSTALTEIADDYGRYIGRLVRQAGMEPTPEMQGLSSATAMAVRSLAIDRMTYPSPTTVSNSLLALRTLREELIQRQLPGTERVDPTIPGIVLPPHAATRKHGW